MSSADAEVAPGEADRSLPQLVYERLREQIVSGSLAPGQRLIERELADALKVSRVPLRAALPRLEADGLIKILPRRGAVVTQFSMRDIAELFDLWEVLEVMATRRAARLMAASGGAGAEELAASMERAREAVEGGDKAAAEREVTAFHTEVHRLADHRILDGVMRVLEGRRMWLGRSVGAQSEDELAEHRRIYDAIVTGREDLAAALAFAHVAQIRQQAMAQLQGRLPEEPDEE